ncbi:MAG: reverse transcriptase domain-containing protein, partial [Pirellulaceae bacterium]
MPTLVTFIDVRKAYDTVWREGNYVRLFDMGVQGKMWRQIQKMGENMKSKVRLSIGETDWVPVKRGLAQGAVESPWLYSCFIDGMTEELKRRGLGIRIAGVLVPLLLYADDIVLLASTISELKQMNQVASEYAFRYRFRHNGDKSAVMVFNADKR